MRPPIWTPFAIGSPTTIIRAPRGGKLVPVIVSCHSIQMRDAARDSLDRLVRAGCDAIDLSIERNTQLTGGGDNDLFDGLRRAARLATSSALRIESITCDIPGGAWSHATHDAPESDDFLRDGLRVAAELGARLLTFNPPPVIPGQLQNPRARYALELNIAYHVLDLLALDAECAGVTIALRAPYRGALLSPVECCDLVDRVNSPAAGICIDADELVAGNRHVGQDLPLTPTGPHPGADVNPGPGADVNVGPGIDVNLDPGSALIADWITSLTYRAAAIRGRSDLLDAARANLAVLADIDRITLIQTTPPQTP